MTRDELDRVLELHRQWMAEVGVMNPYDPKPKSGRANLYGANLAGADLRGADLGCAYLCFADLSGADLSGANLSGADLRGAELERADLRDADLADADLDRANLRGADLSGAYLLGADLGGANLRGVRTNWLTRMTARGTRNLSDEQRAQLGMQPPRAENAGRGRTRTATDLARRLRR
jgi:uncharacterized protein YjbI with pentapeptide repeats